MAEDCARDGVANNFEMNKLHSLFALLLLVDFGLWAGGSVSLWQAARRTVHLKRLLQEVAPGEAIPETTLPMFASAATHAASLCAMPTKKWLLVPVLGPLMIAKQHHIHAQCLQARLSNITVIRKQHTRNLCGLLYVMAFTVTLANLKLPFGIPGCRINALLLDALAQ
ncbi:hypothetical protein E2C01_082678 [Portunus trituberculatus]|uniref:Uncharacterized protein n=1 Tax=Portunus trituberculatus TaxID=210409 RepID=A0A5B7IV71_PORTR|nr:hypothetical protein [Portunus trituberculatus]